MRPRDPGTVAELRFTITIGAVLLGGVVALIGLYHSRSDLREELRFAAQAMGGAAAIYSAFYVGRALRNGIRQHEQKVSLDLLENVHGTDLTKLRHLLDGTDFPNLGERDAYDRIVGDGDLHAAARGLLNRFERIAVAVREGAADEGILYLHLNIMIAWYINHLRGYINVLREQKGKGIYNEVDELVRAWASGTSLRTGKPLPRPAGQK